MRTRTILNLPKRLPAAYCGLLRLARGPGSDSPAGFTGYYERIYSDPRLRVPGPDRRGQDLGRALVGGGYLRGCPGPHHGGHPSGGGYSSAMALRLTAEAVVKNWNYYIENGSNRFNNVESFEATGEYEVTAYLSEYDNSTVLNTCVEGAGWFLPLSTKRMETTWCTRPPWGPVPLSVSAAI